MWSSPEAGLRQAIHAIDVSPTHSHYTVYEDPSSKPASSSPDCAGCRVSCSSILWTSAPSRRTSRSTATGSVLSAGGQPGRLSGQLLQPGLQFVAPPGPHILPDGGKVGAEPVQVGFCFLLGRPGGARRRPGQGVPEELFADSPRISPGFPGIRDRAAGCAPRRPARRSVPGRGHARRVPADRGRSRSATSAARSRQ